MRFSLLIFSIQIMKIMEPAEHDSTLSAIEFWSFFNAKYLPKLHTSFMNTSLQTQRHALGIYACFFFCMPHPNIEPYFRQYLTHPTAAKGFPNKLAATLLLPRDVQLRRPPLHVAANLAGIIVWGRFSFGDDGKASIDEHLRRELRSLYATFRNAPDFKQADQYERQMVDALIALLTELEWASSPSIQAIEEQMKERLSQCAKDGCSEVAHMLCSKCQLVVYCGREHQVEHWKDGHKRRCFTPPTYT